MEKFAVDLDKVLDEFEFSEDCAEKIVPNRKHKSDLLPSQGGPTTIKDSVSLRDEVQELPASNSKTISEPVFPGIVRLDSLRLNNDLSHGIAHNERKLKKIINKCNTEESTSTSFPTYATKVNEDRRSSNIKLNVSGVFSCLNEYINSGCVAIDVGNSVGTICVLDENRKLSVEKEDSSASSDSLNERSLSNSASFSGVVACSNYNDTVLNYQSPVYSVFPTNSEDELRCGVEDAYLSGRGMENGNFTNVTLYVGNDKPTVGTLSRAVEETVNEPGGKNLQSCIPVTSVCSEPVPEFERKVYEEKLIDDVPNTPTRVPVDDSSSLEKNCDAHQTHTSNEQDPSETCTSENSTTLTNEQDATSITCKISTPSAVEDNEEEAGNAGTDAAAASRQLPHAINEFQNNDISLVSQVTVVFKSEDDYDKEFLTNYLEELENENIDGDQQNDSKVIEEKALSDYSSNANGGIESSERNSHADAGLPTDSSADLMAATNSDCSIPKSIARDVHSVSTVTTTSTTSITTTTTTSVSTGIQSTSISAIPTWPITCINSDPSAPPTAILQSTTSSDASANDYQSCERVSVSCSTPSAGASGAITIISTPTIELDTAATSLTSIKSSVSEGQSFENRVSDSGKEIMPLKHPVNESDSGEDVSSQNATDPSGRVDISDTNVSRSVCVPSAYDSEQVVTDNSCTISVNVGTNCCSSFEELSDKNCNSFEKNLLENEKSAPNVNNVISIECQRMKTNIGEGIKGNAHLDDNSSDSSVEPRVHASGLSSEGIEAQFAHEKGTYTDLCSGFEKTETSVSSVNVEGKVCSSGRSLPSNEVAGSNEKISSDKKLICAETQSSMASLGPEELGSAENTASLDAAETSSIEIGESPLPSPSDGTVDQSKLGKVPPLWVPDGHAPSCMLCNCKFTVLKRRHHCRACGKVFCSKCCNLKLRLAYMNDAEVRVCQLCHDILAKETEHVPEQSSANQLSPDGRNRCSPLGRQPNPNNPMEYCSTIPPLEQAASSQPQPVPSVLVPVGVLKREGSRLKSDVSKQVMFSDGIRPGGDLTELDDYPESRVPYRQSDLMVKHMTNVSGGLSPGASHSSSRLSRPFEQKTKSYIPAQGLPPLAVMSKGELKLQEVDDMYALMSSIRCEMNAPVVFALNKNLFVQVKILNLDCCVHRICWCFTTVGMSCVGQDEIVIVLECLPEEDTLPKDIFSHLEFVYHEASRGNLVNEMGHTTVKGNSFLNSAEHGGFIYIRPSFQCLHKLILPSAPFLFGILIHRWEVPWAKVFPIRLMLRLGAEFRYYPCMLVSVQQREPVYCEIGHTIMNLLADFRNLSYTLPSIRGMVIHMEDRHTSILLPKNRYDQVTRALNNSNDHVLALAANFSLLADSHLVCIQSQGDSYHTQAINIHNKPRKVTGASFVVFNGALKISSNLTAKSTIVEDGLMVQITPDMIQELRSSLHKMKDFTVHCGPNNSPVPDETVDIRWVDDDHNFNVGVQSVIDGLALDGIPSIRVHNSHDYMGKTRFIRWTEVFIIQSGDSADGTVSANDPIDISRVSENLANATCAALCDFLDLLAQGGFTRIAVRANIHHENVGYTVGGRGETLPPIYLKTLDSALVPVLHHAASAVPESPPVCLELLFHIMLQ